MRTKTLEQEAATVLEALQKSEWRLDEWQLEPERYHAELAVETKVYEMLKAQLADIYRLMFVREDTNA